MAPRDSTLPPRFSKKAQQHPQLQQQVNEEEQEFLEQVRLAASMLLFPTFKKRAEIFLIMVQLLLHGEYQDSAGNRRGISMPYVEYITKFCDTGNQPGSHTLNMPPTSVTPATNPEMVPARANLESAATSSNLQQPQSHDLLTMLEGMAEEIDVQEMEEFCSFSIHFRMPPYI
ncbi:unnamed protein product [Gongylonema pulchrum]|uniref:NR LBD domain-containing protein n=1 Tax=Gongylonema pulchrum TaxID=637853 RepID=A0A183E227_9BILA|nr:unnamed protein product [Gongylonema pulchrum]